jgi:apolipoprotein D and lipocalin family protein
MKKLINLSLLCLLSSCSSLPELKTVEKIEIPKFMGSWYVIANIPTFVEKGAHNALETYTWNEKENRIDVDFSFNKDSLDGEKKNYPQKAFIHNTKTNAEWRIQFIWPLRFAYLIVDVAPDYSWTIIGVPDRDYVWIMARTPTLSQETYDMIVAKVKENHFDISKLQKIPHNPKP